MRQAARRGLGKLAPRLTRPVAAVVRFEEDGPTRRVELILQGRGRRLVAEGVGRYYGPALSQALARLSSRIRRVRRPASRRARRAART
jgi:hypothetical protein